MLPRPDYVFRILLNFPSTHTQKKVSMPKTFCVSKQNSEFFLTPMKKEEAAPRISRNYTEDNKFAHCCFKTSANLHIFSCNVIHGFVLGSFWSKTRFLFCLSNQYYSVELWFKKVFKLKIFKEIKNLQTSKCRKLLSFSKKIIFLYFEYFKDELKIEKKFKSFR